MGNHFEVSTRFLIDKDLEVNGVLIGSKRHLNSQGHLSLAAIPELDAARAKNKGNYGSANFFGTKRDRSAFNRCDAGNLRTKDRPN